MSQGERVSGQEEKGMGGRGVKDLDVDGGAEDRRRAGGVCGRKGLARRETTYLVDILVVRPFSLPSLSFRLCPASVSSLSSLSSRSLALGRSRCLARHRAA